MAMGYISPEEALKRHKLRQNQLSGKGPQPTMKRDHIMYTPEDVKIVKDPHHGGLTSWMYWDGDFWNKPGVQKRWTRCKKVSMTPDRLKVLATLFD
jgi:hypothetical protein